MSINSMGILVCLDVYQKWIPKKMELNDDAQELGIAVLMPQP
jgi:hypothetical protein